MKFEACTLPGVFRVLEERHRDARGMFSRLFCEQAFAAQGLTTHVSQCSVSVNPERGTLRGMHLQKAPFEETKLIKCLTGRVHDVLLDLRPDSPTYGRWMETLLDGADDFSLYVPAGVAHGFQTLAAGSVLHYQISAPYAPEHAVGIRWNDPAFGIRWPLPDPILSDRDRSHPDFSARVS